MKSSASQKAWTAVLADRLGGDAKVETFRSEAGSAISIFSTTTDVGIFTSTIGLMELNQSLHPSSTMYTEIMIESAKNDRAVCNLLASAAFHIMTKGWKVSPGVVFGDLVTTYYPDTKLPHLYFTVPYQGDGLDRVALGEKTIFPLLAIPISEAESQLARKGNGAELEAIWESKSTDVLDWQRASVV